MADNEKLSKGLKLGYGAGDIGGNLFFTVVAFWLMQYLTDEVGLSATLAGSALLVGKIWDAITDPTIGFLSDRTRTRWGRRRPWMFAGAIPLGISFWYMFTNPGFTSQTALFIWATLTYMLICTFWTFVNIPYNALTPELTHDFDERTSLNGYRMIFAATGTLIGAGAALPLIQGFGSRTTGYMVMGAVFGGVMILSTMVPILTVHEKSSAGMESSGNLRAYLDALKNRPFLIILGTWIVTTTGVTVVTASLVYYFKYVLNNEGMTTIALAMLIITAMLFIPVTVKLSEKIGKKQTYILGIALFATSLILIFLLGHLVPSWGIFVLVFLAGSGFATHYVMPWAIVPDTIEYDYAESGKRREGIYYSIWTFSIKLGQAVAGLAVGLILDLSGYLPNVAQSESAQLGIRFLIGPVTAFFFIVGALILLLYPIDRERYREIREKIAIMEGKE